jgi:hypothetical protein
LLSTSPAINAGVDVGLTTDYAGTAVPQGIYFDIGAYEFTGFPIATTGLGWEDILSHRNFKGSVNFADGFSVEGVPIVFSGGSPVNLPGLTASVTELNYTDGVTSNIQTQLNSKLDKSDTASLSNRIDLKANIASPTFTGTVTAGILKVGDAASNTILSADSISTDGTTFLVFDGATQLSPNIPASGQGELGIYSRLLTDTIPIFVFGLGSGQAGDTAVFNDNAIAGAFWNNESDTLVITSLMGVLAAGSGTETIDVQVSWHTNLKDGSATNLNSSAYTITSITAGDEDTSFANAEIPPKQWVWCTISGTSAGNRPSMLILTLSGYYKNQSW